MLRVDFFFVVKGRSSLAKPLSDVVRVTVRPTTYLILGVRILSPSVGALFSRYISITCT